MNASGAQPAPQASRRSGSTASEASSSLSSAGAAGDSAEADAAELAAGDEAKGRRRTLMSWASLHSKRDNQRTKRWATLPSRGSIVGRIDGVAASSHRSPSETPASGAEGAEGDLLAFVGRAEQRIYSTEAKNEIDLAIAALESVMEDVGALSGVGGAGPRLHERIRNVVVLLRKFRVDESVSATVREMELRRFVAAAFVRPERPSASSDDREVAAWISENVFAPAELRHLREGDAQSESASQLFQALARPASRASLLRLSARRSSMPSSLVGAAAAAAAASAAAATQRAEESAAGRQPDTPLRQPQQQNQQLPPPPPPPLLPVAASAPLNTGSPARHARARKLTDVSAVTVLEPRLQRSGEGKAVAAAAPVGGEEEEEVEEQEEEEEAAAEEEEKGESEAGAGKRKGEGAAGAPIEASAPETRAEALAELSLSSPAIAELVSTALDWGFDVFALADLAPGRSLLVLTTHLMHAFGLFDKFGVSRAHFCRFMSEVESRYLSANPYHNAVHAADVVQTLAVFLKTPSLSQNISSLDVFSGLVAAAVHDVAHPGTNNAFQIATNSPLAVTYNDRAVLENFHLAEAFRVMARAECDVASGLTPGQRREFRETVIRMVLATDMQAHLAVMSEMQASLQRRADAATGAKAEAKKSDEAVVCLRMALHCADVSNPCKPLPLYRQWVSRVCEEFFRQGDLERSLGLPVSPLMDRVNPNVPKSQVGFIDFFIRPLFDTWVRFAPECDETLAHLAANRAHYDELTARGVKLNT
jgi:cAMP-specific phosphodiesterase 4